MKRRTKLEWYVLDTDGQDTLRTRVTKKGLREALEQLAEWTELYNALPESEKMEGIEPRIELYEQDQYYDGFAWEQEDYYHYQPEDGGMPEKAQRLWDNR